ncbi:MAG: cytochrome o ubiquinol oxidase subunit III [Desulfobacterales bacterium]
MTTIDASSAGEFEHPDTIANQAYGFWLYIMSDLVLFGTVFSTYVVLSHNYAGGPTGKDLFHLPYTFGETMFLLFSSASYGLSMLAMQRNRKDQVLMWLFVTFLLGLGFISMEINEFYHMILEGNGPERSGFLSAFFTLVGTHGTHVTFGLLWMVVMMVQAAVKGLTPPVQSKLIRLSIFWHFLDIVWVGVFTIVYLMGVM